MKRNAKLIIVILSVLMSVNLMSCKKLSSYDYPSERVSAYEMIKQDLNVSAFRYALERADLAELLDGGGDYTVFLPTNSAFINSGYPIAVLQEMPIADLTTLVKNHIVAGKTDIKNLTTSEEKTTLSNQKILLERIANSSYVDGGDITNSDQETTNGSVNLINKIIVTKPTMLDAITAYTHTTSNSQFTISIAAITQASTGNTNFTNLLTGSVPYTFFLPNNGAWKDAGYATEAAVSAASPSTLEAILKNHLIDGAKFTTQIDSTAISAISGQKIYFDKSRLFRTTYSYADGIKFGNGIASNIKADNGIVHTVSRLLPTPIATSTLDRIKSDANLTIFAAMLKKASEVTGGVNYETLLSDPLKSYTVFAVTNAGMIAGGYESVADVNASNPAVLAETVKFHLILKRANNINYIENGSGPTLLITKDEIGTEVVNSITFLINGGFKIKGKGNVNTIDVISQNVITTNGLLNIIGTVLKP